MTVVIGLVVTLAARIALESMAYARLAPRRARSSDTRLTCRASAGLACWRLLA